ncbi:MAG: hypothetical protein ABJA78_17325 [Ferruginibacter sp.]
MNKLLFLFAIVFTITTQANAQETVSHNNAIGIRLGPSTPVIKSGITFQHYMPNNNAIEAIASFGDGFALCGLYEIHKPLATDNLGWFIGFGGYAGFSNKNSYIGAAGIVGLKYDFNSQNIPLNISLDWKPELNIVEKVGFEASAVGFSARFTF